jgi:short-subunit dehydrogenase
MRYRAFEHWWRARRRRRPAWMNALMMFCFFMALIELPFDLFGTPIARDQQVWFGIVFHGWWAKLGELAHWAVYAAGAYGFWHMRTWMWPWASLYAAQVAFSMFVWLAAHRGGAGGVLLALLSLIPFGGLAALLWRARPLFHTPRESFRARYGEWALITGASAGLGAAFARALARDGMSCVLSARRADRLTALAAELERTYGVQTRVVPLDLAAADAAEHLASAVSDLDLAVVVANAGYGLAGRFAGQDTRRLVEMVQLNCTAPLVLASRLVPRLQDRGRGAVVIVSSVAGHQPVPYNAVYSATKAFDLFLGEALWAELQGTGVDVLVLQPGPTETEFQQVAGETPHPGAPPEEVVEIALHALGHQPSIIPGWVNWLRSHTTRFAPRSIVALIAGRVMAQWTPDA